MSVSTKTYGVEGAAQFTSAVAPAFATSPITIRFICEKDSLTSIPHNSSDPSRPFPPSRLIDHFTPLVHSALSAGAVVIEACDWAAAALWEPPEFSRPKTVDPNSGKEIKMGPVLTEYRQRTKELREKYLGVDKPYWHLSIIGRSPGREEKGAVRAVIDPYLQKSRADKLPVMLEAISESARDVYKHFGFKVLEEYIIGKGSSSRTGAPQDGGEGFPLWFMRFDPKEQA